MKKHGIVFIIVGALILSACGTPEMGIEVHNAWMRPAAQGDNGAVYFELHNHSSSADELVGASSAAAEAVEIHETVMEGDVMRMQMLSSIPLEASAEIAFEPGGLHVMLIGLKQDFAVDDHIEVVLHFEHSEDLTITVHVEDSAPEGNHSHE